jgi:hypothetical protein
MISFPWLSFKAPSCIVRSNRTTAPGFGGVRSAGEVAACGWLGPSARLGSSHACQTQDGDGEGAASRPHRPMSQRSETQSLTVVLESAVSEGRDAHRPRQARWRLTTSSRKADRPPPRFSVPKLTISGTRRRRAAQVVSALIRPRRSRCFSATQCSERSRRSPIHPSPRNNSPRCLSRCIWTSWLPRVHCSSQGRWRPR